MSTRQDEDIRIYQLPEVQELSGGMKVAVDSEEFGTQSFDLSKFKPESEIYMLKYSEVSSIDDIDVDKAVSKPTFMQIDVAEGIEITIPTSSGSTDSYTQRIYKDTILKLDEVGPLYSDETSTYNNMPQYLTFSTNVGSYAGGTFGENADLKFKVIISATLMTGVTKLSRVMGDIELGSILGQQPQPVTKRYRNWRGPGNAYEGNSNSMVVEFQQGGRVRSQLLPGAELASHDFSSDSGTPEVLQMMAWGKTSNRAGYKEALLATHSTRSSEYPTQTPSVSFNRYVMGSSETSDNVATSVNVEMISSVSGQESAMFGGNLVPSLGTIGALQYWSDNSGPHYGFKPVKEVPTSTTQDEGKVLTVDSNGGAVWGQSSFVVTLTEDLTTSPSTLSIDKTFIEINTAIQSSQSIKFNYDKKSPIGTVRVFSGSDVQTVYGSYIAFNCVGSAGKVTSVRLNVSDTVSIVESNNLPTSTSSDEGKVLTVDSNGAAAWASSGADVMCVKYISVPGSSSTLDKTFSEIKAALDNKKAVILVGPNPNVIFDGQSTIGTEYLVQTYTNDKIVFRSTLLVCPYSEAPNSAISEIVFNSNNVVETSRYVHLNASLCTYYPSTITTSTYTIPINNSHAKLTVDPSVSNLTLNISNVDTVNYTPANFVVEIEPTAQLTLNVTRTYYADGEPDTAENLKYSVDAGNTLEAGKYYQITVVGDCWTLAEFANPT